MSVGPMAARGERSEWRLRRASSKPLTLPPHSASPPNASSSTAPSRAFPPASNLCVEILVDGVADAARPRRGDRVHIHYACLIASTGGCVDASRSKAFSERAPYEFQVGVGQAVPGMDLGVLQLRLGSIARLHVPSRLGYGPLAAGAIPPHTDLVFEIELLQINSSAVTPTPAPLLRRLLMVPALSTRGSLRPRVRRRSSTCR